MSQNGKLVLFVACAALSAIIVFAYAAPRATAIGAVWKSCCAAGYPTCDYGPSCVLVSGWYCCSTGWSLVPCPDICTGCANHTQSCVSLPCCGAYSSASTCYYSGVCGVSPKTCTFSTCSLLDQCSGTNRCGSASGDTSYSSGSCGSGGCNFVTEECGCGALDTDGGQVSTKGTCTDYTGCSGTACTHVNYTDSCVDGDTVREYYVTGTGDAATCGSVNNDCTGDDFCDAGRCVPEGTATTTTTTTTLPGACNLVSASVTASCSGGASADCEAGETVFMSGTYSGTCSLANLLQIDATSADGLCDIEYTGGDMSGVWDSAITLSGGLVSNAAWTIPAVAEGCTDKTVSAQTAALWNGLPDTGTWIDGAETVSGSFKFAGAAATTTLSGTSFTLAIKPGWNLISVPYRIISGAEQDDCGATNGNFYFYDAATGKWNVRTVGITNLRKATSYWFYSTGYCSIIVRGYDDVVASDVVLAKNEWSDVGAPKGGMNSQALTDAACPTCTGNRCSSMTVLYYDTLAGQFKTAASLQEGVGYRVQCVGS